MGIYHVLQGRAQGNRIHHAVILHIPVPPAQQLPKAAEALAEFKSAVPGIDPNDLANIRAGEIIEWPVDGFHSRDAASIDGMINRIRDEYQSEHRPAAARDYKDKYEFYLEESDTLPA